MNALLIAVSLLAAGVGSQKPDSNCYQVWDQMHCDVMLEPKPPIGGPPADRAAQPCRDAKGQPAPCPAVAPKHCQDANGQTVDCQAPGAKPA